MLQHLKVTELILFVNTAALIKTVVNEIFFMTKQSFSAVKVCRISGFFTKAYMHL